MNKVIAVAALVLAAALTVSPSAQAGAIAYHGLVVTDVSVAGKFYQFATVRIDLVGDTRNVQHVSGSTRYTNSRGYAVIRIDTGLKTYTAQISANQIYAVADVPNLIAGFGAQSGGYLLLITQAGGQSGGDTTIAALADILAGGNAGGYSNEVFGLGYDLKTPTNLTGAAFSCPVTPTAEVSQTPFPFGTDYSSYPTYGCSAANPSVTVNTGLGPVTLYSPYLDFANPNVAPYVPAPYSLNWGVFWAESPPSMEDD